jgi:hypothetical protein
MREGYNNSFYGKHHTEEAKQKNREAHLGTKLSEETKMKMSESHRQNDVWTGRKHSEASILKMKIAKLGKKDSEEMIWEKYWILDGELLIGQMSFLYQ